MTSSSTGWRALAVAVATALAAAIGLAAPTRAEAAQSGPELLVAITSVKTTGKERDQVTLDASVTNTGDVTAYGVQAFLWRSRDAIKDLATMEAVADLPSGWGERMWGSSQYHLITLSTEAFEPGETATVTLSASLAQLGFDRTGVAYPIGIQALGTADQSSNYVVIGQQRTFWAMPSKDGTGLTDVVVLTNRPTAAVDGTPSSGLGSDLNGRLEVLLQAAEDGASYLIDPALVAEVTELSTESLAAGSWLQRLKALPASRGARSLFANPDLAAAAGAGGSDVLAWSQVATEALADSWLSSLPTLVLPASAAISTEAYRQLPSLATDVDDAPVGIIATNTRRFGSWQPGSDGLPVLAATASLDSDQASELLRTQRLLAEAAIAGEDGQVRLITDDVSLQRSRAARAGWLTDLPLADLIGEEPEGRKVTLAAVETQNLTEEAVRGALRIEDDVAAYGDLVPTSNLVDQAPAILCRGLSQSWIGADQAHRDFLKEVSEAVGPDALATGVVLDATQRFVMSSKQNDFPITITNNLSEPIRVKVRLTPTNTQRLQVPDSEMVTIAPGRSQTVNVRPQAISNGVLTARAKVITAQGKRVTPDTTVVIEVTDLGLLAWVVVIASGLFVVGASALRIRQVRRRQATEAVDG